MIRLRQEETRESCEILSRESETNKEGEQLSDSVTQQHRKNVSLNMKKKSSEFTTIPSAHPTKQTARQATVCRLFFFFLLLLIL